MTNIDGINNVASAPAQPTSQAATEATQLASKEELKSESNAAILSASLEVSINSGNEAMSLLYKAAIENINETLAPEFGNNAIESAYEEGLDASAEATADRIVALTTAMFPSYQEQHPGVSAEEAAADFAALISEGITKGFDEAKGILDGLGVLDESLSGLIDETYEEVQNKLQEFVDKYTESDEDANDDSATAAELADPTEINDPLTEATTQG